MSVPTLPLVEVRAVSKSYGGRTALRDVSLSAEAGRVLALLGPNGAGKSTLLRIAAGIARPDAGEVRIGGRPVREAAARRRIGAAGHLSFLYGYLTVEENLHLYARLYGVPVARVEETMTDFGMLAYRRTRVRELSRGLVQRTSLARALLHSPAVLLLDEPFTGLDAEASAAFRERIRALRGAGRAIVMATHAWADAQELADEAVVLAGGRLALRDVASALDPSAVAAAYRTA